MFKALKEIVLETWSNKERLIRLSLYDLKSRSSGTILGSLWYILNPTLQILVYWLVFTIGISSPKPRGNYPYIVWMITGIIPWFFISESMMGSMSSIFHYKDILKRTNFPVSLIPLKTVLTSFINHLMAMLVVIFIFFASGGRIGINFVLVFYYFVCALVFLFGYALFASAVSTVFRDFEKLMSSVIRLLFYLSPVVWSPSNLSSKLQFVLKINPIAYIIDGYRNSILYNANLLFNWKQGIYFWVFTILLLMVGSATHVRFRKHFIDVI